MLFRTFNVVIVALLFMGMSTSARAIPIQTYEFVAADGMGGTVTGSFGWDFEVVDSAPNDAFGDFVGAGFLTGLVSGGSQDGASFSFTELRITITDSGSNDHITFAHSPSSYVSLFDEDATALSGDDLPTKVTIGDYEIRDMFLLSSDIGAAGDPSQVIGYEFQSISAGPVPEPSSALLLAAGLVRLAAGRRGATQKT